MNRNKVKQEILDLFARYGSGDYEPTEDEKQIIDTTLNNILAIIECDGQYATEQDRKDNANRCARYGLKPTELQVKWRGYGNYPGWKHVGFIPEKFDIREAEDALLDAFTVEGCAHVWCGDGSSCAAQVVEHVYKVAYQRGCTAAFEKIKQAAEKELQK